MLSYQRFDFAPKTRIALTLRVAGREHAIVPGKPALALNRCMPVIEAEISQNFGSGRISGPDLAASMDQPLRLIEVDRFGDIGRNDLVVLPRFGHAINLNGQQHGDSHAAQFASQHHDGRTAPALTEENDARPVFFLWAETAVVVAIQKTQDGLVGGFSVPIFEDLHVGIGGIGAFDALGHLNWPMIGIVMPHESAHEANHDVIRKFLNMLNGAAFGKQREGRGDAQKSSE